MLTKAQRLERQSGIGGSDIGAILGVSPFKSAVDIYLAKTAPLAPEEPSELTYWGHAIESLILQRYEKEHGVEVERPAQMFRHSDYPWMTANVDGRDTPAIVEAKNVGEFAKKHWGSEDTDSVPLAYLAQCHWYMAVLDAPHVVIAALFGGNSYREFRVERDLEMEAILINKARAFWFDHVLARIPPPAKSLEDAARLFPKDDGATADADDDLLHSVQALKDAKEQAKRLATVIDSHEAQIKARMGTAALLAYRDEPLVSWKSQSARRFDSKAFEKDHPDLFEQYRRVTETRVFRIK